MSAGEGHSHYRISPGGNGHLPYDTMLILRVGIYIMIFVAISAIWNSISRFIAYYDIVSESIYDSSWLFYIQVDFTSI